MRKSGLSLLHRRAVRRALQPWEEPPRYTNDSTALEQLFRERNDPWNFLTDPYEQARLTRLCALVQQVPHASVLEIGCAEGLFTAWLTTVAEHVVALDVSSTACARARERASMATVFNEGIETYMPERTFDLVVCAETLYYMRQPAAALTQMRQWGTYILLAYTRRERLRLDPLVTGFPTLVDEEFTYVQRRFPPKRRGCRVLVWGPCDAMPLPGTNRHPRGASHTQRGGD